MLVGAYSAPGHLPREASGNALVLAGRPSKLAHLFLNLFQKSGQVKRTSLKSRYLIFFSVSFLILFIVPSDLRNMHIYIHLATDHAPRRHDIFYFLDKDRRIDILPP